MTMLNLDLRHLQEQKLEHYIQTCFNPCCFCNDDTKSFTHCSAYTHDLYKMVLLGKIKSNNCSIL